MQVRIGVALLLVFAALLAQRWYPWNEGLNLGGADAESYEAIARAAPAAPQEKLLYHHAQRWAGPYMVGLAAKTLGADVRSVFAWAAGACLLGAILLLQASLARAGLRPEIVAIGTAVFAFHWSLRFYLVAPGMLPDALFILGLALTLHGLASGRLAVVLAGLLVAGLARQTVLLIVPGVAYWMMRGELWARRPLASRSGGALAAALLATAVYLMTGAVCAPFSEPSENLEAVTALFAWIAGPEFSAADLVAFAGYAAMPLLVSSALLAAGCWRRTRVAAASQEAAACLLMVAAVVAQPLLGGPDYTGAGNAMRLSALALAPLVFAMAAALAPLPVSRGTAWLILPLLAVGSLHYNYTLFGPRRVEEFVAVQLAVAVLLAWLLFRRLAPAPEGA